ncbi:uncharacterized protein LOC133196568 [Saccostrea echinata]|uniref:uncharacterized protein LOC133196568 n=1 Tax=Saccostrea echinata TaxID=191078 RepID=UPI002A7F98DA|nr:uncharacterized protein LOC133196568 [Saccostrea echinata]
MSDFLLSVNTKVAQPIISCLNLSEGTMIQLAESYIGRAIPGLVVHNQDRRNLPKLSDHSHWMVSGGRLFKNLVRIAIRVPGISGIQIQNCKNPIESKQLLNEFDVIKTLQGDKIHVNIVKMFAFNPNPSPIPFYVIESFQTFLIDKLLHARKRQEFLSQDWMNNRFLDIASAIDFLHQKKIIHRDITINSFAIREYPSNGHEKAVLCSLEMACSNDIEASANTGHIGDIHGENIPTRWSAPESLWDDKYDVYTDIWMIGHVIHTLFTYGCEPYTELYSETTDDIMAKVVSCGLKPYKWRCVPLPYHQLATECLHFDRRKRTPIDKMCQRLKEMRKNQEHLRKSCKHERYFIDQLPKISDQQTEREHKPERGIPLMVKKMKELPGIADKRKSYFEIKRRVPTSPNPDYAPLVMTLGLGDLLSPDEPKISRKGFELEVEEEVTVDFHDKILPKMSKDFAEKMCITKWPPVKQSFTLQEVKIILKYSFPACKNIIDLASSQERTDDPIHIVHQVACLVKRMHEKHWLLVDITGKNIYIQEENDLKACQVRIGRMLRLPTGEDSVTCGRKLEDIMYWLPKEVIGHGEMSTGSDVYTMAMLFYEFYMAVSGNDKLQCVPFSYKHRSHILSHLHDGHFPDRPPACPEWLYEEVMKPCWDQDRTSRLTAADVERIVARRITTIHERKKNAEIDTYDRYENMSKKLTELNFVSHDNLEKAETADDGESDEDYAYVQPADQSSGSICLEEKMNTYYNDERTPKEEFNSSANTSNKAQHSAKEFDNTHQRKGSQEFQKIPDKEYLKRTCSDQSGELVDVPNYELFSQSEQFDAGTEEEYPYSETPNYENETIHSSRMNIVDPQPFRINISHLDLPSPHVHKENPVFQSDASSYPCAYNTPSCGLDCELQVPTRASTCEQEDSSDDTDYEN